MNHYVVAGTSSACSCCCCYVGIPLCSKGDLNEIGVCFLASQLLPHQVHFSRVLCLSMLVSKEQYMYMIKSCWRRQSERNPEWQGCAIAQPSRQQSGRAFPEVGEDEERVSVVHVCVSSCIYMRSLAKCTHVFVFHEACPPPDSC